MTTAPATPRAFATLDDAQLQSLYAWVDAIPLSRPKRSIGRDFADGVLYAEVVAHYCPRLVDLHNYPAANSMQQKLYNWDTLNVKVLRKLDATLSRAHVDALARGAPGAIESALHALRATMLRVLKRRQVDATPQGTAAAKGATSSRRTSAPPASPDEEAHASVRREPRSSCTTESCASEPHDRAQWSSSQAHTAFE